MTPSEIITADAQQHGIDPQKVLAFVHDHIVKGHANLTQANNTLLFIIHLGQSAAEVHLYTVDNSVTVAKSIIHFIKILKQSPIKVLYGKADNPGIIVMMQKLGLDVQHSNMPQYNWMATL